MSALHSLRHATEIEAEDRAKTFGTVETAIAYCQAAAALLKDSEEETIENAVGWLAKIADVLTEDFVSDEFDWTVETADFPLEDQ
jgi:hypothetical protein